MELDQHQIPESIKREAPDIVLLGTRLVTDGGAVPVVHNLEAMTTLKELVRLLRNNDIATFGTYMNGFWEDDAEKIRHRCRVVDEIDPDIAVLMLLTPMPGSPIWRQALKESRLESLDLQSWDAIHATMPTRYLSRKELAKISSQATCAERVSVTSSLGRNRQSRNPEKDKSAPHFFYELGILA